MCQDIIEIFRQKCIRDTDFSIAADQKYGPMTTKLKASGAIASAYVDFPARLMVNIPGDVKSDGKKRYQCHTNFSSDPVDL